MEQNFGAVKQWNSVCYYQFDSEFSAVQSDGKLSFFGCDKLKFVDCIPFFKTTQWYEL